MPYNKVEIVVTDKQRFVYSPNDRPIGIDAIWRFTVHLAVDPPEFGGDEWIVERADTEKESGPFHEALKSRQPLKINDNILPMSEKKPTST